MRGPEWDRRMGEYTAGMANDPSSGHDPSNRTTEFERFEALTKRLVAVGHSRDTRMGGSWWT
jgi:hypothetical protein